MSLTDKEKTPTVIIAYRKPGNHLEDSFQDLKKWFKNIVVVGPENSHTSRIIEKNGGSWLVSDSPHIDELWEKGISSQNSDWYILVQDKDYLSTVLKESVVETTLTNQTQPNFIPFDRKSFFLKQQMKYNLSWVHDPPSGLLFAPTRPVFINEFFDLIKTEPLKGELIHFGERTLNEAIQNSIHRADWLADQLYKISPVLKKKEVLIFAIKSSLKNFFSTWFLQKGIREGFEGVVFCFLDSTAIFLGYLRYWEKYIRSGKQIADNKNLINKILVIKLRGLGDAVLATPVLKNLKTLLPHASVSVLTFNFTKDVFENNSNVDEIYGLPGEPPPEAVKKMIKILSEKNFDLIINLHSRNFSSQMTKKIKSRWRISGSYAIREKYISVLIGSDHELDKTSIERDLDCIRVLGLDPIYKEPKIYITKEEEQWAKEKLEELKIDPSKKIIMIHPASSQVHKNWGMERFVQLSRSLINDCGYQVIGIFPPKEQSMAKLFQEQVDGIFISVGPLRSNMALIQQANLVVDNCSGPSHISVALQVPTIVLMGVDFKNTYRDENIYKDKHFLFFREVPCRDVFLTKCLPPDPCQNRICMDHSVEAVFNKSLEILAYNNGKPARSKLNEENFF